MKILTQVYSIGVVVLMVGCLVVFGWGCGAKKTTASKEKGIEPGLVEQMAGGQQLRSYQKAKSTLDALAKSREEQDKEAGL